MRTKVLRAAVACAVIACTATIGAIGQKLASANVVDHKQPIAPTIRTINWTVPDGLPSAGTVRKAFIVIPNEPRADFSTVLYTFSALAPPERVNPGSWSVPEIGRWEKPPEGRWLNPGVFEEKEAPLNEPNVAAWSNAGLYVIGLDQGNDYGANRAELPEFVRWMNQNYHTAPVVEGWVRSRGGLYLLNLLAEAPSLFDRVGGIAPITDGKAYDAYGIAMSYTRIHDPIDALKAFTAADDGDRSLRDRNAPNMRTAAIAASNVPIMLAYGTADGVVFPADNTKEFYSRYISDGGKSMTVIPVEGADHELTKRVVLPLRDFMISPRHQRDAIAATSMGEKDR